MIAGLVFVPFLVSAGQVTSNLIVSAKVTYNCSMQSSESGIQLCTNNPSMPSKQKFEFERSALVQLKMAVSQ